MFKLKDVKYKDILDIKDLEIMESKVTSITGASGSGKTTLIRLLNKLVSPDSGEILYKGKQLSKIDSVEHRRNVVMLSQEPAIFKGTIRDNLLIGLRYSEKEVVSDDRLMEVMKSVNLDKNLDDNPEKLSGGEKQRLAIGRVMIMNPETLILDEPSSALDDDTEELVIGSLVDCMKKQNRTVIMVTHSKRIAEEFSDETLSIVRNGRDSKGGPLNE